ncbi:hypothetical protein ACFLUL_03675 [Chloroflexota bacterium]
MLVFAHTGISLGAAALISGISGGIKPPRSRNAEETPDLAKLSDDNRALSGFFSRSTGWFHRLSKLADIRLLLIGSLLPDIIDKPLG